MSTLDLLLSTAVVNGLRQFNVTRIGTAKIEWQAATRWHGRDGYCVAIRDTPEQAATEALSAHPLPSGAAPPPAIPNFTHPPDRIASGGYPMPKGTTAPKAASLDDWDDDPEPEGCTHPRVYRDGEGVTSCAECGEIIEGTPTDAADDLDGW